MKLMDVMKSGRHRNLGEQRSGRVRAKRRKTRDSEKEGKGQERRKKGEWEISSLGFLAEINACHLRATRAGFFLRGDHPDDYYCFFIISLG